MRIFIYFSWSNNTKKIVDAVSAAVKGDVVRLERKIPYSTDYNTCAYVEAKEEYEKKIHPEIKDLNIDFSKYDDDNLENRILGAMIADETDLALLYRNSETKNRNRYTLAHELAHCCLAHLEEESMPYIELRHDGSVTDTREIEANIFAGELLIPITELRGVLSMEYLNMLPKVTDLAKKFAVSTNVMKGRLRHLKIPYIDEYGCKIFCLE